MANERQRRLMQESLDERLTVEARQELYGHLDANPADAAPLARALLDGGLGCMEVTFRTAAAADALENLLSTTAVPRRCPAFPAPEARQRILLAVAGCSPQRDIVVIYSPHGPEILKDAEAAFEAAYPQVDMQWLDMGSLAIFLAISSSLASAGCSSRLDRSK